MINHIPSISIGRIPVHLFTEPILNSTVLDVVRKDAKIYLLHANAHLIQLANTKEYSWLIDFFNNEVDLVMCDGAGIQFAARITNQPVPIKIAYNVWFWSFIKFCAANHLSLYLLGAKPEVVEKAANNLRNSAEGLVINYHHGYFDKDKNSADNIKIREEINRIKPNILIVAFGMPLQEKWLRENFDELNVNIMMTAGGAFDFFSGNMKVAPSIMSKLYLEWLYRLIQEPRRLWKRYLFGNLKFIYYSLKK